MTTRPVESKHLVKWMVCFILSFVAYLWAADENVDKEASDTSLINKITNLVKEHTSEPTNTHENTQPDSAAPAQMTDDEATNEAAPKVRPLGEGTQTTAAGAEIVSDNHTELTTDKGGQKLVSLDCPDASVRELIINLATLYDLSIVVPPNEDLRSARTSLRLRNVTWQNAYDTILEGTPYTYTYENSIVKIIPRSAAGKRGAVINSVLKLAFVKADNVLKSINGILQSDKRSNAAATTNATKGVIQHTSNSNVTGGSDGPILIADAQTNTILVRGTQAQIDMVKSLVQAMDIAEAQVMIESKIVSLADVNFDALGIRWGGASNTDTTDTTKGYEYSINDKTYTNRTGDMTTQITQAANSFSGPMAGERLFHWGKNRAPYENQRNDSIVFTASEFKVVLRALEKKSKTKVVSNPTVVTMNNETATIKVVEQYPIAKYEVNQQTGATNINGFDYKDIGLTMKVTPTVRDRFISMDVAPELSAIKAPLTFTSSTGTSQTVPDIVARSTTTHVTLQSGYTLAMSGLISETSTKTVEKVPFLGDIPVIGRLFQSKTDNKERDNLVVFLTATQIGYDGSILYDSVPGARNMDPRSMYSTEMTTDELPGQQSVGEEREMYQEVQRQRDIKAKAANIVKLEQEINKLKSEDAKEKVSKSGSRSAKNKRHLAPKTIDYGF